MNTQWKCVQNDKYSDFDGLNPKIKKYLQKVSIADHKKSLKQLSNINPIIKDKKTSLRRKQSSSGMSTQVRNSAQPLINNKMNNPYYATVRPFHLQCQKNNDNYSPLTQTHYKQMSVSRNKKRHNQSLIIAPQENKSYNSNPHLKNCHSAAIIKNQTYSHSNKGIYYVKNRNQNISKKITPKIVFNFANNKQNHENVHKNSKNNQSLQEFKHKSQCSIRENQPIGKKNLMNFYNNHCNKTKNENQQFHKLSQTSHEPLRDMTVQFSQKVPVNIKQLKKLTKMFPLPKQNYALDFSLQKTNNIKASTLQNSQQSFNYENQGQQNCKIHKKIISFSPGKIHTPKHFSPAGKSPSRRISHIKPGLRQVQSFFDETEEYNQSDQGSQIILRGQQVLDQYGNLPYDLVSAFRIKPNNN